MNFTIYVWLKGVCFRRRKEFQVRASITLIGVEGVNLEYVYDFMKILEQKLKKLELYLFSLNGNQNISVIIVRNSIQAVFARNDYLFRISLAMRKK